MSVIGRELGTLPYRFLCARSLMLVSQRRRSGVWPAGRLTRVRPVGLHASDCIDGRHWDRSELRVYLLEARREEAGTSTNVGPVIRSVQPMQRPAISAVYFVS
jgi:hypothetical protein